MKYYFTQFIIIKLFTNRVLIVAKFNIQFIKVTYAPLDISKHCLKQTALLCMFLSIFGVLLDPASSLDVTIDIIQTVCTNTKMFVLCLWMLQNTGGQWAELIARFCHFLPNGSVLYIRQLLKTCFFQSRQIAGNSDGLKHYTTNLLFRFPLICTYSMQLKLELVFKQIIRTRRINSFYLKTSTNRAHINQT